MTLLAIDCAGRAASVAVLRDGAVLAEHGLAIDHGHAVRLVPLVAQALAAAGVEPSALRLLVATRGPGSFTGIRVGLAAITGLSLASGAPMLGIDGFDAWAATVRQEVPAAAGRPLVVALDTRRRDLFVRMFRPDGAAAGPAAIVAPDRLLGWVRAVGIDGPALLAGDGAGLVAAPDLTLLGDVLPVDRVSAAAVARWAEAGLREGRLSAGPDTPAPIYLREADAVAAPPPRHHVAGA